MATNTVHSSHIGPRQLRAHSGLQRSLPHPSRSQLFKDSERRLAMAASSGIQEEELVASRLLGDAGLYYRWEVEHGAMLGRIVQERRAGPRQATLVSVSLTLIHRKALFEYLRDSHLRGLERATFIHRIFGGHEYARLIVREHENYIRSAASFLCLKYLGSQTFRNPLFGAPLQEYDELYASFCFSCCEAVLLNADDPLARYSHETAATLKRQLALRRSILLRCARHDTQPDKVPPVDRRH
jgi:hypothetical protein